MTDAAGPALPLDGDIPEWVHLLPPSKFTGADGRGPYHADANALVAAFAAQPKKRPLVVDFAHQTFLAGKSGSDAPAAGWIVELQARSDGVWGRVEWTPGGRRALQDKEYRFISPVFSHGRNDLIIKQITGAGLVNNPNLPDLMPVINSAIPHSRDDEREPVAIERLVRRERDEGTPDVDAIMANFGLPTPETTK